MRGKILLILGMGHNQADLAVAAREYGANVYACAKNINGPVKDHVDGCAEIDILDIDGVVDYAREIEADAIFTLGLEVALGTIALASERLGLYTFFTSETLNKFENKVRWRQELENTPGNLEFSSGTSSFDLKNWDIYPAIMKPADSSGQRGVIKVNNFAEVESNFSNSVSYSRCGLVILEEFVQGDEVSVNSFMDNGVLKFAIMSDRISYKDAPGGIIKEHHIPSKYDNKLLAGQVYRLVEDVNRIMGFQNGHVYFQLKINEGKVSLIEFTPRFDACHMWRLIRTATGLDLLQITLEKLFEGSSRTLNEYEARDLWDERFILKFNSDKPGTMVDYANYSIHPDIIFNYWYYQEGEKVKAVTNIIDKVGYYIYSPTR